MQDLTFTKTLESTQVSGMLGKEHKELLKDIRKYIEYFIESKVPLNEFFLESH